MIETITRQQDDDVANSQYHRAEAGGCEASCVEAVSPEIKRSDSFDDLASHPPATARWY